MYLRCANKQDEQWTIVAVAQRGLAEKYFETVEEREGMLPDYRFSDLEDFLLPEKLIDNLAEQVNIQTTQPGKNLAEKNLFKKTY